MGEKDELIRRIREVNGRDPSSLNEMLNVLVDERVIALTKAYLQTRDRTDACKKYQAPWNCALEAQAFAQTVYNAGWGTTMADVIENWCVNCQARLYGEDPGDIDITPDLKEWLEDPTMEFDKGLQNPWVSDDPDIENTGLIRDVDGC